MKCNSCDVSIARGKTLLCFKKELSYLILCIRFQISHFACVKRTLPLAIQIPKASFIKFPLKDRLVVNVNQILHDKLTVNLVSRDPGNTRMHERSTSF